VLVGRDAAAELHAPVGELVEPATDPAEHDDGRLGAADHPNGGSGALECYPTYKSAFRLSDIGALFPDIGSIQGQTSQLRSVSCPSSTPYTRLAPGLAKD
jgi:hypothetical protein